MSVSENSFNSYDSNGVLHIFISALGDEKWELPISLFTCSFATSPGHIRTYKSCSRLNSGKDLAGSHIMGNSAINSGTESSSENSINSFLTLDSAKVDHASVGVSMK